MTMETPRDHTYTVTVTWRGNTGSGTSGYRAYERAHDVTVPGKPVIHASSDPAFRGDRARYNPEEMLVASISSCHMLWYLHLCATEGVVVQAYEDKSAASRPKQSASRSRFVQVGPCGLPHPNPLPEGEGAGSQA